jgi:hypothetical protein
MKNTWGILKRRRCVFLLWFDGLMGLELGELRREGIVGLRRERVFESFYRVDTSMISRCT